MMTRRQALKTTALASAAFATLPSAVAQMTSDAIKPDQALVSAGDGPFTLPPLPYAYDALEPFIDAETMHIHHDKHHAAYVANLNKALADVTIDKTLTLEILMKDLNSLPESHRTAIRNNGGGHYNHSLFWQMMKPGGDGEPTGNLAKAIDTNFGNFSTFKDKFAEASTKVFGSGWAWLVAEDGKLKIVSTPNQDTPLSTGQTPLLGLDVWEHAYYLKHQNKRVDYIAAWWDVVNWDFVSERYAKATA